MSEYEEYRKELAERICAKYKGSSYKDIVYEYEAEYLVNAGCPIITRAEYLNTMVCPKPTTYSWWEAFIDVIKFR